MTFGIILEAAGNGKVRFIVLGKYQDGHKSVENVFESDDPDCNAAWAAIAEEFPNLTHIVIDGLLGEWDEPDCLTVREAAVASYAG